MKCITSAILLSILLLPTAFSHAAKSSNQPLWEAGIAVGGATLPQYMGSDERYNFAAPIPFFIYRGERLRVDRGGITTELFGVRELSVDASLGVGLPVRNSNQARAGMPELKFSFQAGPRLNWQLHKTENFKITLRAPWRGVVDTSGQWLGWLSEPDIAFEYQPNNDLLLKLYSGALFGSRRFHSAYYDVPPIYATASRATYRARAGLHSLSLTASARYRLSESVTLFSAIRYRNLASGVIANSPLVKDHNYLSGTVGLAWSFWKSDQMSVHKD